MNKERKNVGIGYVLLVVMSMATGFIFGGILENLDFGLGNTAGAVALNILFIIVSIVISAWLQTVIHESGHLVFGLLTGYKFLSFRIGSLMFIKENDRIVLKKFSLAGTGGQCLMGPPDYSDDMPIILYNMGGVIMNLISAALFGLLFMAFRKVPYLGPFLILLALMGVAMAMLNGIPMESTMVSNDGKNCLDAMHDKTSRKALWAQLKIARLQSEGVSVEDMDESLFAVSSSEDNVLVNTIRVFRYGRLMSLGRFEEAYNGMAKMLSENVAINNVHRQLMTIDCLYCELIGANDSTKVAQYYDGCKNLFKSMKDYPSVIRTRYAYEKIHNRDEAAAEKQLEAFKKAAEKFPYPKEIEGEEKLIQIVKNR